MYNLKLRIITMKKYIIALAVALLPMLATAQVISETQPIGTDESGVWNVEINSDVLASGKAVTITGLASGNTTVQNGLDIPGSVNGSDAIYTVTRIGKDAFNGYAGLTGDVTVPATVTIIDKGIFSNCPNIRSITFLTNSILSFIRTLDADTHVGSFDNDTKLEYIDMSASAGFKSPLPNNFVRESYVIGDGVRPFQGLPASTVVYLPKDMTYDNVDDYILSARTVTPMPLPFTTTKDSPTYEVISTTSNSSVPVAWTVTGYDADGDGAFSMDEKPDWIDVAGSKLDGDGGIDTQTITIGANNLATPNLLTVVINNMQKAKPVGTDAAPYDLSTHNVYGTPTRMNTANSYVVSGPGTYMLPLVYGNAIKNGVVNEHAYKTNAAEVANDEVRGVFADNTGANITSPYIQTQKSNAGRTVSVEWADKTQSDIISNIKLIKNGNQIAGNTYNYIQFTVPNTIIPANALVSVKDNGGNVLWSWHLWFTQSDALDEIEITNKAGKKYQLTTQNLGFVPTSSEGYEARNVTVQVQQEISGKLATFSVSEEGKITKQEGYAANYQWGRKDPFVQGEFAAISGGTMTWTDWQLPMVYYPYALRGTLSGNKTLADGISNPSTFYTWLEAGDGNWTSDEYANLWSMEEKPVSDNTYNANFNGGTVIKTIYDPCPVGFSVPTNDAFTGFGLTNNTGTNLTDGSLKPITGTNINAQNTTPGDIGGFYFYTDNDKTNTIFFQAGGNIDYNAGDITGVNKNVYYSTAQPLEPGDGKSMVYISVRSPQVGGKEIDPPVGLYTTYSNNESRGQSVRPMVNDN